MRHDVRQHGRSAGRPFLCLLLLLWASLLPAAEPETAREYLVDLRQAGELVSQDILPTWQAGDRRLFCLEDLLRLARLDHLRKDARLEIRREGHVLRAEADKSFLLLDQRLLPLPGPVLHVQDGMLVDVRCLDSLLGAGLLNGEVDHEAEGLVLERSSNYLALEELQGGQVLRLGLEDLAPFEAREQGRRLELSADPSTALGSLGRKVEWSETQSDLLESLQAADGEIELRLRGDTELVEIVEVPSLGELQFVLRREGERMSEEFQPREAPKLVTPSGQPIDLDVIVIDAGHGGKDPGAVSPNNNYEKTVALALALALRDELRRALPDLRIVMTRDDDTFLSLGERTRMANREGGKLFISIHANAAQNRSAKGWEVFFLRPGKNRHAREVALRENSVISFEDNRQQEYTVENWILASMAQSAYVEESQNLAALIARNMKGVGNQRKRPINQQGFFVLVGASMPSVLFECGFITNRQDEKFILSRDGQKRIARALAQSVIEFRELYREGGNGAG